MKRSRIALLVAGAATCVLLVPALAFGVGGWQGGLGQGAQAGSTTAAHHGVCAYGDCDYVDADGDGVCDNWSDGTCPGNGNGAGNGQGYGNGGHHGNGHHGNGHGRCGW